PAPAAPVEERAAAEPVRAPEPPQKAFEELVVSAESVLGLQIESALSSERARVEDRVEAHVVRDVRVSSQVAIPAGAKALGSVMLVERGGKFKERVSRESSLTAAAMSRSARGSASGSTRWYWPTARACRSRPKPSIAMGT